MAWRLLEKEYMCRMTNNRLYYKDDEDIHFFLLPLTLLITHGSRFLICMCNRKGESGNMVMLKIVN